MRKKVLEILASVIGEEDLERYPEDTDLIGLGLTSILLIQFIVKLEDALSVEILDSDLTMRKFETLQSMFETLQKYFSPEEVVLKKVLVCDCDNVLWQGISGEERLYLSDREIRFQKAMTDLYQGGVLLCLCSKNEEKNILESFAMTGMQLSMEHIVTYRINRTDKATNLLDIAAELNLSPDSFVFVDDSDYELGLIQSLLPQVTAVKADAGLDWIETVCGMFSLSSTPEDRNRTELYREQKFREQAKSNCATVDEYNRSLQTVTVCNIASESQFTRLAELSQRTNQCNLSAVRYSEEDLVRLSKDPAVSVFFLSASDRYGDMGIVGGAVLRKGTDAVIESFFLSCRVFDRGFEALLLDQLRQSAGAHPLAGIMRRTEKNRNYHDFYQKNGVTVYE